jgi:hypothetical protein
MLIALSFPTSMVAQEVTIGRGVICDTQEQLRKYAALSAHSSAIDQINEEVGTTACGVLVVAYVIGPSHGQVRTADGPFTVTEITVVAMNLGPGWMRVPPLTQFTLFKVKEEES